MFTGIVEEIGIVDSIQSKQNLTLIGVKVKKIAAGVKLGDSIAIDGVCLTIVKKVGKVLYFEAMKETLLATTVGKWRGGTQVNLERALLPTSRFGGHFVTGHVDGLGIVKKIMSEKNFVVIQIQVPSNLKKFIVQKGSITLNGVSLTVGKVLSGKFDVYLIPYTLKETNLGLLKMNDQVNIEVDILARYVLGKKD